MKLFLRSFDDVSLGVEWLVFLEFFCFHRQCDKPLNTKRQRQATETETETETETKDKPLNKSSQLYLSHCLSVSASVFAPVIS